MLTYIDLALYGVYFAAGFAALLFIALFSAAVVKYRRDSKAPTVDRIAVKRLGKLRGKQLLKKGMVQEFCLEMSGILTDYARARFGMGLKVMTAAEFAAEIDKISELAPARGEYLKGRLELCDLVRYSGYVPGEGELDPKLAEEIKFVKETAPKEEAPA